MKARLVPEVEKSPAMTKSCARDLTDRIKVAAHDLAEMLYRAHEGRAWEALGYASWKEYCEAEFQMSKSRSYQLLDFVEIKRKVSTIVDSSSEIKDGKVSSEPVIPAHESQTRPLKSVPMEKQTEAWRRAVEIADGEQPTAMQVEHAVVETKVTPEDDDEIEDDGEPPPSEGLALAEQAIAILNKIRRDDTQRGSAFDQIRHWLWNVEKEKEEE